MVLRLLYLIIFDVNDNVMGLTFVWVLVGRAFDTEKGLLSSSVVCLTLFRALYNRQVKFPCVFLIIVETLHFINLYVTDKVR